MHNAGQAKSFGQTSTLSSAVDALLLFCTATDLLQPYDNVFPDWNLDSGLVFEECCSFRIKDKYIYTPLASLNGNWSEAVAGQ